MQHMMIILILNLKFRKVLQWRVWEYDKGFVADFMKSMTMKEFWASVCTCQSYEQM